ncbi:MAG: DNA cytosine methyltransferase [Clostridia bacterium]|nr:DNA cytosine methyltransferase [Clostridia bacterium]
MYTTLDLFSGAGGITEGFKKAGFRCMVANDIDEEARHTFLFNHPEVSFILGDIRQLSAEDFLKSSGCDPTDIDVITGGPPCQGFSLAGKRFSDDPRNTLFKEYVRIAKEIKPKVIFFENVPGIMSMQNGNVLEAITSAFKEIGYACRYALVNAADYGVPQTRLRFVLIGSRDYRFPPSFPPATHGKALGQLDLFSSSSLPYVTVEEALSGLPAIDQGEGEEACSNSLTGQNSYSIARAGNRNPGMVYNHRATKHSKKIQDRYALIPQGHSNAVLAPEIRTKKQNAFKLDLAQPAKTVTCNFRTDLIHPIMNRGLTVREAARLQSFDDDYRFFGNLTRKAKWLTQDDQVGNAVPPLLAYAFARHIQDTLLPYL